MHSQCFYFCSLQEPTTGLDSSLAFEMMKTLQCFATEFDKAIVTTIHLPASHIFHMFEKILLLANGQVRNHFIAIYKLDLLKFLVNHT